MKHISKYLQENEYLKIAFCLLAIVLLCILISNSYFNAKYRTNLQATNSASIAGWHVSTNVVDNTNNNLSIVSENNAASYTVEVNSTSEVTTRYTIVLTNVPTGLQVKLDGGNYQTPTNNKITFNAGTFAPSDATPTHTHTLTFNDPLTTSNSGNVVVNIDVLFEQID